MFKYIYIYRRIFAIIMSHRRDRGYVGHWVKLDNAFFSILACQNKFYNWLTLKIKFWSIKSFLGIVFDQVNIEKNTMSPLIPGSHISPVSPFILAITHMRIKLASKRKISENSKMVERKIVPQNISSGISEVTRLLREWSNSRASVTDILCVCLIIFLLIMYVVCPGLRYDEISISTTKQWTEPTRYLTSQTGLAHGLIPIN